jgi:hypothetical protein
MFPQMQSIKPATMPAPVGGINSLMSLAAMQPTDALYLKNIDPTAYGLKVRPGYSEWANGYSGDEVKTIIPYKGRAEDGSEDLLLACTSVGIYDITASTTTPSAVVTWGTSSSDAGWCSFDIFTNDNGDRVLLVCDLANGLQQYLESTQTWSVPTITGVSAGDLVQMAIWKKRVWYVEKDTNNAWYSGVGTYSGALTTFNFGSKFRAGVFLSAIYGWTLDSGVGPDDYLVATSSAGDVVVYAGTNPSSSATFGQVGVWFVGQFPTGRRQGSQFGGDLLLLSSYGVISCKDLLQGKNPFTEEGSLSYKINRLLNAVMARTIDDRGWEIKLHPDLAKIIICSPKESNQPYTQFTYDINLKSWGLWTGIPMTTSETYNNEIYCGAALKVYKVTGSLDNITLAASDPQPVYWSFLTAYNELEEPQINKVVEFIRPRFYAAGEPTYRVQAYYDYDLSEQTQVSGGGSSSGDVWDTGAWDSAIWGGGKDKFQELKGASGMGRTVALAMSGASTVETYLVDMGIMWRSGGML